MGSSNEAKELQKFATTNEGKTIDEIGHSSFEQNIYITGNYDINFFSKYLTEFPQNPILPEITSYIKMAKHNQIKEWHFFFNKKSKDFEEIKTSTKNFWQDHYENDPDDFMEKSKTRSEKIVIIYFNDDNKDKFATYFLKEHNQNMIPFIIFIGTEEENTELKNSINKSIKDLNKHIDSNLFKYLTFNNENIENTLIQLIIYLIECSSFYNELGDEFKFPKKLIYDNVMENNLNLFKNYFFRFNIMVMGRPGVGKSTFINRIINSIICKAGRGGECSSRIIRYLHRLFSITFFDTPGISTIKKVEEILNLIRKKNSELSESKTKIHAVFYLLEGNSARSFMDYEEMMFECLLNEMKVPVYFVLTKISNKEEGDENLPFMIKNFKRITKNLNIDSKYKGEEIKNYIFFVNVFGKNEMGLDKLFSKLYNDFRGKIIDEKIDKYNIERLTSGSLIGTLKKPKDIINHPKKLCEYMNLMYRLMARSINSKENGSTNLSVAFLKQIYNIYGHNEIKLDECKRNIQSMKFEIDSASHEKEKKFKTWAFFGRSYWDYKTPAEEQIDYLGDHYVSILEKELSENDKKLLEYINGLRISMNEAIESLDKIGKQNIKNLPN